MPRTKKQKPSAPAARKTTPAAKAPRPAEFIAKNATLSAAALAAKAKSSGVAITVVAPEPAAKPAKKRAPKAKRKPVVAAPRVSATPAEHAFRKLVLELGVVTARGLVADVEAKLEALIAGK